MRKLISFNMVSLDGFFEGPHRELNWHTVDEEFIAFSNDQLNSAGELLFGRITYQLMASYWPTASVIANDPLVAHQMNSLPKTVFSTTLSTSEWNNTTMINGSVPEEVEKLKRWPGKDILVLGSSRLTTALTEFGLIDEYRMMVNPIVLGNGNSLFNGLRNKFPLNLLETKTFKSGNVLLCYERGGR